MPALAVLVPDQAAFPDTARLLPVMVPALARASPVGRAAERLIIRALADHGVYGPLGGRMKPAAMTSFSLTQPPRVRMRARSARSW